MKIEDVIVEGDSLVLKVRVSISDIFKTEVCEPLTHPLVLPKVLKKKKWVKKKKGKETFTQIQAQRKAANARYNAKKKAKREAEKAEEEETEEEEESEEEIEPESEEAKEERLIAVVEKAQEIDSQIKGIEKEFPKSGSRMESYIDEQRRKLSDFKQTVLKKAIKEKTINTKDLLEEGRSRATIDNLLSCFAKDDFLKRISPGVYEPTNKTIKLFKEGN